MKIDFKDLIIDEEDRKLFLVDDTALKAEALQYSILPKLENIFYLVIEDINKIYQLDVLEYSRIKISPNFKKTNRSKPVAFNYEVCNVGLTGKIKTGYWSTLIKKDNSISQRTPLDFIIQLSSECIDCYLVINPNLKLKDHCYEQFDDWVKNNFLNLFPLLQEANARYKFFCSDECKPFTSLNKYFIWKKKENVLESGFFSERMVYPLNEMQFKKIKAFFLYLFPIYQTFIDISKGDESKFIHCLSKIQDYHFNELNKKENEPKQILTEKFNQDIDLNELAEQKIRFLSGIRWQVFQRDNWKCVACGRSAEDEINLHVDHIIPRSKGGLNSLSNYQTLCNICNIGKSNKDDTSIRSTRNNV